MKARVAFNSASGWHTLSSTKADSVANLPDALSAAWSGVQRQATPVTNAR